MGMEYRSVSFIVPVVDDEDDYEDARAWAQRALRYERLLGELLAARHRAPEADCACSPEADCA